MEGLTTGVPQPVKCDGCKQEKDPKLVEVRGYEPDPLDLYLCRACWDLLRDRLRQWADARERRAL